MSISASTINKLFYTGATLGPLVDSLHNQCLLTYDIAPITLSFPIVEAQEPSFYSSWLIPPLLGFAYVILGGVVPRFFSSVLSPLPIDPQKPFDLRRSDNGEQSKPSEQSLRYKAILAVLSTALIIRTSEFLTTNGYDFSDSYSILSLAAFSQWILLDRSLAALLSASIASIGGPLSELPFVAFGCWHYLPQVSDYFPLAGILDNYSDLALSSITGPCYFAVTMDAIALGRWFDSMSNDEMMQE